MLTFSSLVVSMGIFASSAPFAYKHSNKSHKVKVRLVDFWCVLAIVSADTWHEPHPMFALASAHLPINSNAKNDILYQNAEDYLKYGIPKHDAHIPQSSSAPPPSARDGDEAAEFVDDC